jgi:uncharacterized small protein (DUF1192 family)
MFGTAIVRFTQGIKDIRFVPPVGLADAWVIKIPCKMHSARAYQLLPREIRGAFKNVLGAMVPFDVFKYSAACDAIFLWTQYERKEKKKLLNQNEAHRKAYTDLSNALDEKVALMTEEIERLRALNAVFMEGLKCAREDPGGDEGTIVFRATSNATLTDLMRDAAELQAAKRERDDMAQKISLFEEEQRKACAVCGRRVGTKLCSACRTVRYCGEGCSHAHWKEHKKACRTIREAREASAREAPAS